MSSPWDRNRSQGMIRPGTLRSRQVDTCDRGGERAQIRVGAARGQQKAQPAALILDEYGLCWDGDSQPSPSDVETEQHFGTRAHVLGLRSLNCEL